MSIQSWTEYRLGAAETAAEPGVSVHEFDSGAAGPTLLVLAGVHGDEVGGIVAAGSLVGRDLRIQRGRLRIVPIAHEDAWRADSRESPTDGLNLARVFPGAQDGTPTQVLAALIAQELIATADAVVDLHTSSPDTDMPFFAGCLDDGSDVATRSVELALAFGAPLVWTHERLGSGRTLSAANERNIPALYAESPTGGVLALSTLDAYIDGVRQVMQILGLTSGDSKPESRDRARVELWMHGDGDVDAFSQATHDGLFLAERALLDAVEEGDVIGRVVDARGRTLQTVTASANGRVATLRRRSRVTKGTPLVGVVPERPASLGRSSDAMHTTAREGVRA